MADFSRTVILLVIVVIENRATLVDQHKCILRIICTIVHVEVFVKPLTSDSVTKLTEY